MSVDIPASSSPGELPAADLEQKTGPEPSPHGAAVTEVFNDHGGEYGLHDRDTLYDRAINFWREHVGDRDEEPLAIALDEDALEWLPPARENRDYVILLTSSRWKAGTGQGEDYSAYYDQHLSLREIDDDGQTYKPPLALHVELMPQYTDLVYESGDPLECQYGEGTRVRTWSTWADSPEALEQRAYDVLRQVYGNDAIDLSDRNFDSRRVAKAEVHVRFKIGWKKQVIDALESSKQLVAYGGGSDIDAHQKRQREGWLEALVDADRWHLLGFRPTDYDRELKVYQASSWHDKEPTDPLHHPKLEASFAGVDEGALPHVDDWDEVLQSLRQMVSAHLEWAGVDREQLVADEFFDGSAVPTYSYKLPANRREQLKERYEAVATEVYRAALTPNTDSLYDILKTVAIEKGASYDTLEERTGLSRSTIRYHCRRLEANGVVDRIGNPVLVVFPSLEVLDEADEILREINPDDTLEDMRERAEDRRERREDQDDPALEDDSDQDGSGDEGDRGRWEYFDRLNLTADELCTALDTDAIDEHDVRVKVSEYPTLFPPP